MKKCPWTMILVALGILLLLTGPLEAAPPRYFMQDLGDLGGGDTEANGINAAGQVVGYSKNAAGQGRAFLKTPGRPMEDLGTFGGAQSQAKGINDSGQVVGWAQNELGRQDRKSVV